MNLPQAIWEYSQYHGLLQPGARVVLGVSGGPDSLCLLDSLAKISAQYQLSVYVAHLDHGLRAESAGEADDVRNEAEKRGLSFHSESVAPHSWEAARHESVEAAARALRYGFLRQVALEVGADRIAVAHTSDDQAETVLLHLIRGSGLRGLAGMRPIRALSTAELASGAAPAGAAQSRETALFLIRPLLAVSRAQVREYCAAEGLAPRLDPSNLDPRYLRNRIRHSLLPTLEAYNPNIRAVLARTAEVLRGDFELRQAGLSALWRATVVPGRQPAVEFNRERWRRLSDAARRGLLREAAANILGDLRDIDYAPIEAAARFSRSAAAGRSCELARGLMLNVESDAIVVAPADQPPAGENDTPHIQPDGSIGPGWQFSAVPLDRPGWERLARAATDRWTGYVDGGLAGVVTVRARRPGDHFRPLGLDGHRAKVSDFMINMKVPAALRGRWPLVVSGDQIVWVAGLRLDERYRVTAATEQITQLRFSPREQ